MSRNYRVDPEFDHYFEALGTPAQYGDVIPVSVVGLPQVIEDAEPILGIGHVIGSVATRRGRTPIIELIDATDDQKYRLRGDECQWAYPPDRDVVDQMMTGTSVVQGVGMYLEALRTQRQHPQ